MNDTPLFDKEAFKSVGSEKRELMTAQKTLVDLVIKSIRIKYPDADLAEVKLTIKVSENKTILGTAIDYSAKKVVVDPPVRLTLTYDESSKYSMNGVWEESHDEA